jgi:hypothetical protein
LGLLGVIEIPSLQINSRITTYAHLLKSMALKKTEMMVNKKVLAIQCTNITARLNYLIIHLIYKFPRLSRHNTNIFSYKSLTINLYLLHVCVSIYIYCVSIYICIYTRGPGSAVGIATGYGSGPGIESR